MDRKLSEEILYDVISLAVDEDYKRAARSENCRTRLSDNISIKPPVVYSSNNGRFVYMPIMAITGNSPKLAL